MEMYPIKKCARCNNDFGSNVMIKGDDVCRTCDRMNDITFWYPRLFRAGFPTPKTIIIHSNVNFEQLSWEGKAEGLDEFYEEVKSACLKIGLPSFLRTGYSSNKHDWEQSCFVQDVNKIPSHIRNLADHSGLMTIDRFTPCDFWAIREFLKTKPYMNAFDGNMPITQERRYFVRDGKVECHHSYWPREAFKDLDDEKFAKLSEFLPEDEKELEKMAIYVSKLFSGYWSYDFLKAENGQWYLTDMAIGERSYHIEH